MAQVDDLIERRPQQILLTIVPRLAIAVPEPQHPAPENHELAQNRNPKSQESDDQIPLSCKIEYFPNVSTPLPARLSEFFTGD